MQGAVHGYKRHAETPTTTAAAGCGARRLEYRAMYLLVHASMAATAISRPQIHAQIHPRIQLWPCPEIWPINRDFPGLTAVSSEPDVYIVEDLLDEATCERLIDLASPQLSQSYVQTAKGYELDPRRTSSEVRLDYEAVEDIQRRFSELLNMPTSHFEPLKVSRYERDQFFKFHHDCIPEGLEHGCDYCGTPWCNRVCTLFVYLRDCDEGGETCFPRLEPPLGIAPTRGMGVLHFPARMPNGQGERDARVGHEGSAAISEKWICQQWCWTGPLDRSALPDSMLPPANGANGVGTQYADYS